MVLDVDETVLDNSPYQARLVRDGAEFDEATWAAWVAEASARPVPGVLDFAREASERGVTLLYVSNRTEEQQAATLRNLRSAGLPDSFALLTGAGLVADAGPPQGAPGPGTDRGERHSPPGDHR